MNPQQLSDLFDTHHQHLYRMGLRMLNCAEDAEDLLQETFLKACRNKQKIPTSTSGARAWLMRILVNSCRDRYRRKAVRKEDHHEDFSHVAHPQNEEQAYLAKQTIWQALSALPAKRRAVVILHELEGLPPPDIGQLLDMKSVTVRWHLSKGRKAMNAWIQKKEKDFGPQRSPKIKPIS